MELARKIIIMFRKLCVYEIPKSHMLFLFRIKKEDTIRLQQMREAADFLIGLGLLKDSGENWEWLGGFKHIKKNRVVYGEKIQTTR